LVGWTRRRAKKDAEAEIRRKTAVKAPAAKAPAAKTTVKAPATKARKGPARASASGAAAAVAHEADNDDALEEDAPVIDVTKEDGSDDEDELQAEIDRRLEEVQNEPPPKKKSRSPAAGRSSK
jgi:RNA polymerase primary sigma factor